MRTRYHWTQLLGVFICIAGLGLLVASDELTQKGWEAISKGKGDAFMIAGATLYGFSVSFLLFAVMSVNADIDDSERDGRIPREETPIVRGTYLQARALMICSLTSHVGRWTAWNVGLCCERNSVLCTRMEADEGGPLD